MTNTQKIDTRFVTIKRWTTAILTIISGWRRYFILTEIYGPANLRLIFVWHVRKSLTFRTDFTFDNGFTDTFICRATIFNSVSSINKNKNLSFSTNWMRRTKTLSKQLDIRLALASVFMTTFTIFSGLHRQHLFHGQSSSVCLTLFLVLVK